MLKRSTKGNCAFSVSLGPKLSLHMFWRMLFNKIKVSVSHYKSMTLETVQEFRLSDPAGPSRLSRSQILSGNNTPNYTQPHWKLMSLSICKVLLGRKERKHSLFFCRGNTLDICRPLSSLWGSTNKNSQSLFGLENPDKPTSELPVRWD